jgi:hypothetical protein
LEDHNGWIVSLIFPSGATIANLWNGINTGTSGTVTVANQNYNGALPTAGTAN